MSVVEAVQIASLRQRVEQGAAAASTQLSAPVQTPAQAPRMVGGC